MHMWQSQVENEQKFCRVFQSHRGIQSAEDVVRTHVKGGAHTHCVNVSICEASVQLAYESHP